MEPLGRELVRCHSFCPLSKWLALAVPMGKEMFNPLKPSEKYTCHLLEQ
jgi:hypothetical protein